MKSKTKNPKSRRPNKSKREDKPTLESEGLVESIANTKISRRSFIKGSVTAASAVGVASVLGIGAASAANYVTISPTKTNTATVPPQVPLLPVDPFALRTVTLNVNGTDYNVNVEPRDMLVDVIRNDLGLIATKKSCNRMQCGICTVLIDGVPRESCQVMALRAVGHKIVTSEIAQGDPVVNALQQAWVTEDGGQCTYCGPGQIMAATALLKSNTNPTIPQIKAALSGNLCRCGNYMHIIAAVQAAAKNLGGV